MLLIALILFAGTGIFSYFGFNGQVFDFLNDSVLVLITLKMTMNYSYKEWENKTLSAILSLIFLLSLITNQLLWFNIIRDGSATLFVLFLIFLVFFYCYYVILVSSYLKNRDNEEIKKGNIYQIVGLPKNFWQFISHLLSMKGSRMITDGESIWKYAKNDGLNKLIKRNFKESDVHNCNVYKIETDSVKAAVNLDRAVGRNWSLFRRNNCLTISSLIK